MSCLFHSLMLRVFLIFTIIGCICKRFVTPQDRFFGSMVVKFIDKYQQFSKLENKNSSIYAPILPPEYKYYRNNLGLVIN